MSNEQTTVFIEGLRERMSRMLDILTPAIIEDFEKYVRGDLEAAERLVTRLEHEHVAILDAQDEGLDAQDEGIEEGYAPADL